MSRGNDELRALRVGLFLIVALAVAAAGIWVLGDAERLWSAKVEYLAKLPSVEGLTGGSTVALAGYRIGTVKRIYLPEDTAEGLVHVVLSVERDNTRYIRTDTRARIKTLGLLGDKYLELSPGSPSAEPLPPGAEIEIIRSPDLDRMLAQGETMAGNLESLSGSLKSIVEKINQGKGLIGAMISDTPEAQKTMEDFKATMANLRSVSAKIDEGPGMVSTLLNDRASAERLRQAIASLSRVTASLETGAGLLPRLLHDPEFARQITDELTAAAADLRKLTASLSQGQGTIARLVNDEAFASEVLGNVRSATSSLAAIAERINSGEGSLGKLIADETLYEGVNDILAGARKSRLTRWFVTRSQKIGAEQRLEGAAPTATPAGRR